MSSSAEPKGPYRLCTCNTAPERAKRLVGRVIEELKASYTIIHAGNSPDIESVEQTVREAQPDIMLTASMWTQSEASQIHDIARGVMGSKLKVMALPQGLQVERGPDAVVEYLVEQLPALVEGTQK